MLLLQDTGKTHSSLTFEKTTTTKKKTYNQVYGCILTDRNITMDGQTCLSC